MEKNNMDKKEFKIGDRVVYKGKKETVITDKSEGTYGIKFDKHYSGFHSLDGRCESGYGYWCLPRELELIQENKITLSDLQFGDILTTRCNKRYVFADEYMYGEDSSYYCDCEKLKNYYNEDLTINDCKDHDIVKVERLGQIIYERKEEVKEMTVEEISKALGYEVKVVK